MSRFRAFLVVLSALTLVSAACSSDADRSGAPEESPSVVEQTVELPATPAMFTDGCPTEGLASASVLEVDGAPIFGDRVVSRSGDVALTNDHAAFMISAPVTEAAPQRTWYHYGGIVVDGAALDGCDQVSADGVDEVGLVTGNLNVGAFTQSTLRAFRAESIEIVNDGTDGEAAVVRATGTDDVLQLIEYTLLRGAAAAGAPTEPSEPLGIRMEVDYVLEPDAAVLSITSRVIAEVDGVAPLLAAALVTWGDDLTPIHRADSVLEVGGFGIDLGTPWQVAHSPEGSMAFAVADANNAIVSISGVQTFIDANQALSSPLTIPNTNDEAETTFLLAVGPTDGNSAVRHLPANGPTETLESQSVSGTITDVDGTPVADVMVEAQLSADGGDWATYDVMSGDDSGSFSGELTLLSSGDGTAPDMRLRFTAPGRAELVADLSAEPAADASATYEMGPAGAIDVSVTDSGGETLPSRVTLYVGDDKVGEFDTFGEGSEPVAPGTYDVVVSRGFNYDRTETMLVVPPDGSVELAAELEKVVDTSGWMSLDTHVHSAPSPDSTLDPERRMLDAAAVGLEAIVNTNHELIADLEPFRQSSGLAEWVYMITGQEVTASMPEHTTMYPVEPDDTERGGNPRWYGLDIGEIYALESERGASIRGLNHPAGYLDVIQYDSVTGTAKLDDPTAIGLKPDAALWSWDFEQVELQNGPDPVLRSDADDDGLFDFWQSSFNHGEPITAVGASDAHGLGAGGSLTYVRVDADGPDTVSTDQVVDAIAGGEAIVSTGAFANVSIDGSGPGSTVSTKGTSFDMTLRAQAAPGIDLTSIRVFANCDQLRSIDIDEAEGAVRFDGTITLELSEDANITVLGFGKRPLPRPFGDFDSTRVPRFVTNPVFVDVDGNGAFDPPGGKTCSYPR